MAFTEKDLNDYLSQVEDIAGAQVPEKWNLLVGNTGRTLNKLLEQEFILTDIKIWTTYDYELLQSLAGNREVDEKHVERIMRGIKKRGYEFNVIQINESGKVIDGQHRLVALARLAEEGIRLPAFIVVVPNAGRDQVVTINSINMTWKSKHFLQSGLNSDDPDMREKHERIQSILDEFNVPVDVVVSLIGSGHGGAGERREAFKDGTLAFSSEKEQEVRAFLVKVRWLYGHLFGDATKITTRFIFACKTLFGLEGFSYKDLQQRFQSENPHIAQLQRLSYQSQETIFEYLASAYNYRMRNENRIVESRKQAKKESL